MKHPSRISISEFNYELPQEKIAVYPLENRDGSKLLVFRNGKISEDRFINIDTVLKDNSLLVFNNTRVVRARLNFLNVRKQPIEIFCLEPNDSQDVSMAMSSKAAVRWNCLVGNLKRWKEETLELTKNNVTLSTGISARGPNTVVVDFSWTPPELTFAEVLERTGSLPIPPYLKRNSEELDEQRYQTVYAKTEGSVAAPTAGLHFTDRVLQKLDAKSIQSIAVTLHVGAGTFKPVKSDTMQGHDMHSEWIEADTAAIIALLHHPENIIAVGTTSLRTIETLYWMGVKALLQPDADLGALEIKQWDVYDLPDNIPAEKSLKALLQRMESQGVSKLLCRTQILIAPPYELKIAAGIITNFHQPQSTLLLLISAITGERWREIYDYALTHNFRFLSYGDSSVLLK